MDNICSICIIDHRIALATWDGKLHIVDTSKINNPHIFTDLADFPKLKTYAFDEFAIAWTAPDETKLARLIKTIGRAPNAEEFSEAGCWAIDKSGTNLASFGHNRRITKMLYSNKWERLFVANVAGELYQIDLTIDRPHRLRGPKFFDVFFRINDLALDTAEENLFFVNRNHLWQYNIRTKSLHKIWSGELSAKNRSMLVTCRYFQNSIIIVEKNYYGNEFYYDQHAEIKIHYINLPALLPQGPHFYNYQFPNPISLDTQLENNPIPLLDSCNNYVVFSFFTGIKSLGPTQKSTRIMVVKKSYFYPSETQDIKFHSISTEIKATLKQLVFTDNGTRIAALTTDNTLLIYNSYNLTLEKSEPNILNFTYYQNHLMLGIIKFSQLSKDKFQLSILLPLQSLIEQIRSLTNEDSSQLSRYDKRAILTSLSTLTKSQTAEGAFQAICIVTKHIEDNNPLKKAVDKLAAHRSMLTEQETPF